MPILLMSASWVMLWGCASTETTIREDPWDAIENPRFDEQTRASAVPIAWARVRQDADDRAEALERFESMFWGGRVPTRTRVSIVQTLADDPSPEVSRWTRTTLGRALPVETDQAVVRAMSRVAADRGWVELTGPLIRSLARPIRGVVTSDRAEFAALQALHPSRSVERVVFETFVSPEASDPELESRGLDLRARVRRAAWEVLAALDPDGDQRRTLILDQQARSTAELEALRAGIRDLGLMPFNGQELDWLVTLHDDPARRAWWDEAARAISRLPEDRESQLSLRHVEPIRWSEAHRPEWIAASRAALYRELSERQRGRQLHRRTTDRVQPDGGPNRELVSDWTERLSWADLLAALVVDEAMGAPEVRRTLLGYRDLDTEDSSTEYGGVIRADAAGGFEARLFPPRPSERVSDRQFIASRELLAAGATGLAIFHFHAQEMSQGDHAGPSRGDLIAAARLGRTSLVLTSIGHDTLNADLYQPDGVVIDLGELRVP